MKKTLLLLSVAGCIALPAFTRADAPALKNKKAAKSVKPDVAVQPAPARQHMICYITSEPRTGSLIPMVYRRYDNRIDSASSPAVYGASVLDNTGGLDVGSQLYKLEPSITFRR